MAGSFSEKGAPLFCFVLSFFPNVKYLESRKKRSHGGMCHPLSGVTLFFRIFDLEFVYTLCPLRVNDLIKLKEVINVDYTKKL